MLFMRFVLNNCETTKIYTIHQKEALPMCEPRPAAGEARPAAAVGHGRAAPRAVRRRDRRDALPPEVLQLARLRSEEHTSELQSRQYLVCRLLLEKNWHLTSSME